MAGRPRKDTVDMQNLIINLAKCGMTNMQIADVTGIARSTLQQWLSDDDGFRGVVETVRQAKVTLQEKNRQALYSAAIKSAKRLMKARTVEESETRTDGHGDILFVSTKKRAVEPNASMVQFVLKNIDPENWSDRPESSRAENGDEAEDTELKIKIVDGGDDD